MDAGGLDSRVGQRIESAAAAAADDDDDDDDVPFRSSSKSFPLESGGRGGDFLSTGRRGRIRPQRRRSAEFLLAHRRPMRLLGLASPR